MRLLIRVTAAAALLVAPACYRPELPSCQIACNAGGECPGDLSCVGGMCTTGAACDAPDGGGSGPDGDLPGPDGGGLGPDGGPPTGDWAELAVGNGFSCALKTDGTLWCWGDDDYGQTGSSETGTEPVSEPGQVGGVTATDWIAVSAGDTHACGLRGSGGQGRLWCWGAGDDGRLGNGGTAYQMVPVPIGPDTDWIAISAGGRHTCGLRGTPGMPAALECWGLNTEGMVGNGTTDTPILPRTEIPHEGGWREIALGTYHSCAIDSAGKAWCWGAGSQGALGRSDLDQHTSPVEIAETETPNDGWSGLVTGGYHACALKGTTAYCWGNGGHGQLGLGGALELGLKSPATAILASGSGFVRLAAGERTSCGIDDDGALFCWGRNETGEVGDGTNSGRSAPVAVMAGRRFLRVAVGTGHGCAIDDQRELWCWGDNDYGELGRGTVGRAETPIEVDSAMPWVEVVAGWRHTCGRKMDGTLWCWGLNDWGQLGLGTKVPWTTPQLVDVATDWKSLSAGWLHTCGIKGMDKLFCWGSNSDGQVGDGGLGPGYERPEPTAIEPLMSWLEVSAGEIATCGRPWDTTMWCWGQGPGHEPVQQDAGSFFHVAVGYPVAAVTDDWQLWYGKLVPGVDPIDVLDTGMVWQAVSAGLFHACATRQDGTLYCWGGNMNGQVGRPSSADLSTPQEVGIAEALTGSWEKVDAGETHTCGIRDGFPVCWGYDGFGQVGDGGSNDSAAPPTVVSIPGGMAATAITAGGSHSCAIADGVLWCWGSNANGQLGDGEGGDATPALVLVQ